MNDMNLFSNDQQIFDNVNLMVDIYRHNCVIKSNQSNLSISQ